MWVIYPIRKKNFGDLGIRERCDIFREDASMKAIEATSTILKGVNSSVLF
jgi:hypothetical protein